MELCDITMVRIRLFRRFSSSRTVETMPKDPTAYISSLNGALDHWAYWNQVQLAFSRPGKPVENCVCEAFNGSLRRECLSQHWFRSLTEAQQVLDVWRDDYNNLRPHSSLGQQTPASQFRAGDYAPRAIAGRF